MQQIERHLEMHFGLQLLIPVVLFAKPRLTVAKPRLTRV